MFVCLIAIQSLGFEEYIEEVQKAQQEYLQQTTVLFFELLLMKEVDLTSDARLKRNAVLV